MRLDVTDLRLFRHIVEAGSITGGAERVHLALASASERVRGMEQSLGVQLLERGRHGVTPTQAGRALLRHARAVTLQMQRLQAEMREHATGARGVVRCFVNTAAMSEFMPGALSPFLAAHPGIDIDLAEMASPDIVRGVADGEADLGIVADAVDPASGLDTYPFALDRLVLIMPHGHRLEGRRRVAFQDLLDEDFIGLGPTHALQDHIGSHAMRAGRPLKLRVRLASFEAVCRVVASGAGIAIVPEAASRRGARSARLRIAALTDPWARRRLNICVRPDARLPPPAQALLEHLPVVGAPAP